MDEKLYTIPVMDAFKVDCECPLCKMRDDIENDNIAFAMGPSYMEDYIRFETDEKGYCSRHIKKLYEYNNRLGLALIMETHLKNVKKQVDTLSKEKSSGGLFKKKEKKPITEYLDKLNGSCFVCDRLNDTFDRYVATILYLWKKEDKDFLELYKNCKGFCFEHLNALLKYADKELSGNKFDEFNKMTIDIFEQNLDRTIEDVEWFIKKFDYRYKDEPWKNSKDALVRTMYKTNGVTDEE